MKTNNKKPNVSQKDGYVEIEFSKEMHKETIKEQVSECVNETCECCSPEFRENVSNFEVEEGENIKVKIYGWITKDEVEQNVVSCSPKLVEEKTSCCSSSNSECC